MNKKRILIIGGVAGGASCAARARRLSETAEIIMFEQGDYVSFANCGLPYHISGVIRREDDLFVSSPELFLSWFNVQARLNSQVLHIDPDRKEIRVKNLKTGQQYTENYDALLIATGAASLVPPVPGIDLPGVFTLRTIGDMRAIKSWIRENRVQSAVIIGGGFIGLEMCESLNHLNIAVSMVEARPQVMPAMDPEMAALIKRRLLNHKVALHLGKTVSAIEPLSGGAKSVRLNTGEVITTDMVFLSAGIRPETTLAKAAGLDIGPRGGIVVNDPMETGKTGIFAAGDVVESTHVVTGSPTLLPLAGPANRQGRLAAESMSGLFDPPRRFRGVQGSAVCGVMGMTAASTGLSETVLNGLSGTPDAIDFSKIYVHPTDHAGYYPNAATITLKLIYGVKDGKILGAQAVGTAGVEKRIDVIAALIQMNGTVFDMEAAELCYAPQYGSAKDPVNMAGMVAANHLNGLVDPAHWDDVAATKAMIVDVREPYEYKKGHLDGAVNIPLGTLRTRLAELPTDREIWTYCYVGQRSYYAARILRLNGFSVKNISGGYLMHLIRQDM